MSNSINTNIAAYYAQENITAASNASTENVAQLSSGNAIINASDNVAALAVGTSIGTQVSILNAAQTNAAQGTSLLQVADGALAQIQSILQQQQSIANQAQSGSLTNTDRGFLNEEFQTLTNEINALASGTTFNGVSLINGAISGGANINTNITNGSADLPVTATLATLANNVSSGDTISITVAGQPTETFTFGSGSTDVGVGDTAADSTANLAAALNNSGLSQLSDFRFQASGTTLSAYYTGKTTGITNIPGLTITATGDNIDATASPTFSAATAVGTISGTVAAGDTFTIGSHTITFQAEGTTYTGTTNAYDTTTLGNGDVNIGLSTDTNGVTGTALTNLAAFLTSVAGTSGWADLTGITFTTDTSGAPTHLYAAYSGGGSTQPTLSTSYTANSTNVLTAGADQTIQASTSIFNATTNFVAGDTINFGGTSIQFTAGTAGAGQVAIGANLQDTLDALVTFLNTAGNRSTYVGAAYGNAIFSDDTNGGAAGNLYANNTTTTATPYTVSVSSAHNIVGSSASATALGAGNYVTTGDTAGTPYIATGGLALLTHATSLAAGDTVAIGTAIFTLGTTGTTSGLYIDTTTASSDDLIYAAMASYLNTTAGQTASGASTSLVFSDDSTSHALMAYNASDNATVTGPTVSATASTSTVSNSGGTFDAQSGAVVTLHVTSGTALQEGTSLKIGTGAAGGTTVVIGTQAEINAGNAQVLLGGSDAATLKNLRDYLNSSTGQAKLGGAMDGLYFTTDGTSLYVANTTGSTLTSGSDTIPVVVLNSGNINPNSTNTVVTSQKLSAATITGSFSGTSAISDGSTLTVGANAIIAQDITSATTFSIGGDTITFGNQSAVTAGTADVAIGTSNAATLANLATYLNTSTVNAGLADSYKGLTFSSDATHLIATNGTSSTITPTVNTSFSAGTPVGGLGWTAAAIASNASVNVMTLDAGPEFSSHTGLSIGGKTVSFGTQAQVTAGTADVVIGSNNLVTLNNLVSYLNTNKTSFADGFNDVTYSTDGTHLVATADTGGATLTHTDIAFSGTTPSGASSLSADATLTAGQTSNVLTMGINTLVFGSDAEYASGAANVKYGANLAASLDNAVTYLNDNLLQGSGSNYPNAVFSTNGTNLLAQATDGTTTALTAYLNSTDPAFTGVTGKLITSTGVVGLGAGTTSAVGTPSGSLFVTSGSTATTAINYGNGVDLSGVANNADFVGAFGGTGTIGAITANYVNTGLTDTSGVQFKVVVGNDTYTTGTITNAELDSTTAPVSVAFTGSNTTTSAAEGGSFTLTLQPQAEITSQNGADQLATGINSALSGVDAYQNRNVLSYNNNYSAEVNGTQTATLAGSSLAFNSNDFSNPLISSVSVSAPSTGSSDAKITAVINGDTFTTTSGIGDTFGANDTIVLENQSNPDQTVTLTLGSSGSATLSNSDDAAAFQTALSNALGIGTGAGGLTFQLGSTSAANVNVTIASATTSSLFGGASLDVSTATDAATAAAAITSALNTVTSIRSSVGALETQFNFAAAALQSGVQNESAAQSQLLDTNIATVSTTYATNQVKLQAGISVLAQANQQTQALLKLIG